MKRTLGWGLLCLVGMVCEGQQLSREYIRMGGRVIAIESPGGLILPAEPAAVACSDGGQKTLAVTAAATMAWSASVPAASPLKLVGATSFTGNASVTYNWQGSNCGLAERSEFISFAPAGGTTQTIRIRQLGGAGGTFTVEPASVTMSYCPAGNSAVTITVPAVDETPSATSAQTWITNITIAPPPALTRSLSFQVTENTGATERSGTIQVQNGSVQQTVTVVQTGKPALSLPARVEAPTAGGAVSVQITAPAGLTYSIQLLDNPSVVQPLTVTQATGPMTLVLTALPLASGTRAARLQVKATGPCGDIVAETLISQTSGSSVTFQLTNQSGVLVTTEQISATGGAGSIRIVNLAGPSNLHLTVTKDQASPWLTVGNTCQPLQNGVTIPYSAIDNPPTSEGDGPPRTATLFLRAVTNGCPATAPAYAGDSVVFTLTQLGRSPSVINHTIAPLAFDNIPAEGAPPHAPSNYETVVQVSQEDPSYPFVWWPQMNGFVSGPNISQGTVYNPGPNDPRVVSGYRAPGKVAPTTVAKNPCDVPRSANGYVFFATADGNSGVQTVRYTQNASTTPTSVCFEPDPFGAPVENGAARGTYVVRAHGATSYAEIDRVTMEFRRISNPQTLRACRVIAARTSGVWSYELQDDMNVSPGSGVALGTAASVSRSGCTLYSSGTGPLSSSSGRVLHFGFHIQIRPSFVTSTGTSNVVTALSVNAGATAASTDVGFDVAGGAPTAETAAPNVATSATQDFQFDFADDFGFDNIREAQIRFGDTSTPFCDVQFQQTVVTGFLTNVFGIVDLTTGAAQSNDYRGINETPSWTLTNGRCTVSNVARLATPNGLRLTFRIQPAAAFATGVRPILARVSNGAGLWSPGGWTQVGVWNLGGTGGGGTGGGGTGTAGKSVRLDGNARLVANVTDTATFNNRVEWRIETRIHGTAAQPLEFQDGAWLFSANGQAAARVYLESGERYLLTEANPTQHFCRYIVTGKQDLVIRVQRRAGGLPEFGVWEVVAGSLVNLNPAACGTASVPATLNFAGPLILGGSPWGGATNNLRGAIAHFRMYGTPSAIGSTPSLAAEPAAMLLGYEFEGLTPLAGNPGPELGIQPTGQTVGTEDTPGGGSGGGGGTTPPAAGTSVWLNGGQRLVASVPATLPNAMDMANRNEWRIEMRVHADVAGNRPLSLPGDSRLLAANGQVEVKSVWATGIQYLRAETATGECRWVITNKEDMLLQVQRRPGTPIEFGLWAVNGNVLSLVQPEYCPAGSVPPTGTNFTGGSFVLGGPSWGGGVNTITGAIAHFRLYATAAAVGSVPSLTAGTGQAMRWEFEGSGATLLTGESGGPGLSVEGGTVSSVATPGSAGGGTGALTATDIGAVPEPGSTSFANNTYTMVTRSGLAFGTADSMHYAYQAMTGDFEAVVQVASFEGGHHTAKAGLMVRDPANGQTAAGAKEVFVALQKQPSALSRCLKQWRNTANGTTGHVDSGVTATAPTWLRLRRQGNVFTLSCKAGASLPTSWTDLGNETVSMGGPVLVGLGVSAENVEGSGNAQLTAEFTNLTIGSLVTLGVSPPENTPLMEASGGSGSFSVTAGGAWTAASMAQECPGGTGCWLTVGTMSGTGNATVGYTVGNNSNWYGGRSGPVRVSAGGSTGYHVVRQKPAGNFDALITLMDPDVAEPQRRMRIDLMNLPHTLTGVHLDIGPAGGSGPSSTRCYVVFDWVQSTNANVYHMKWDGWATTDQGSAGEPRTIQVKNPANAQQVNCELFLGNATFEDMGPGTGTATRNYKMEVTVTLGGNLPAGVKPIRVIAKLRQDTTTGPLYHERWWEVGYWR
ncbi:MAG: BACON domain-containing carbohydrate-binding protein [Bryobacteraceae bacterium]|nr:BACON domain-containing carbohydrate-binding protein [Bryobacteraceae bacterium]